MRRRTTLQFSLAAFFLAASSIGVLAQSSSGPAQQANPYDDVATRMVQKGLRELGAYQTLEKVLSVGPRLTGSAQADQAVALMVGHMKALGFENVRTEPVEVGHWVRGAHEAGAIVSKTFGRIPVKVRAIGNSIATPKGGLAAGVIEVHSVDEVAKLGDRAKGRIVFFNGAMDPGTVNSMRAYGRNAGQRSSGAVAAARVGAVATVVRSLTFEINDDPHTGTMAYEPGVTKIPAVTISTMAADRLSQVLATEPEAQFQFETSAENRPPVISHNAIGELRGTELPDEVIVIGGHIDSWDLSPGAHDDGAGVAQSIEALRLIRELGLKPKRTIRAVVYMDEENGGAGGEAYAASENRKTEKNIAAIESDAGGFLPLGIGVSAKDAMFARIKTWEPLMQAVGLQWITPGGGGVDIGPLGPYGTILMSLNPNGQRYFEFHHSGVDTLDTVNPRELELGATGMAMMAYLVAQEGLQ
jgi:carboxypeptidase Q